MTWLLAITALWLLGAALTYRWMARELDADDVTQEAMQCNVESDGRE